VGVVDGPVAGARSLCLTDRDSYETAQAERLLPEGDAVQARWRMMAGQNDRGALHIDLADPRGAVVARISLAADRRIYAHTGGDIQALAPYAAGQWIEFTLTADAGRQRFSLDMDGARMVEDGLFIRPARTLQRLIFRTGPLPAGPTPDTDRNAGQDAPGADEPVEAIHYYLSWLRAGPAPKT
jgi:hypothetical protein